MYRTLIIAIVLVGCVDDTHGVATSEIGTPVECVFGDCGPTPPPSRTVLLGGTNAVASNGNFLYTPHTNYITSLGPTVIIFGVPFHAGDRVLSVAFNVIGDASVDAAATVRVTPVTGTDLVIGALQLPNMSPALSRIAIDNTDVVISDGQALSVRFDIQGPDMSVGNLAVKYSEGP